MKEYSARNYRRLRLSVVTFMVTATFWMLSCSVIWPSFPSDAVLINDFQQNKADFDRFGDLFGQDLKKGTRDEKAEREQLVALADKLPKYTNRNKLSFWETGPYRRCFRVSSYYSNVRSGISRKVRNYEFVKGYCWFESAPPQEKTIDNLDTFDANFRHMNAEEYQVEAFRKIEGNWYLYCAAKYAEPVEDER